MPSRLSCLLIVIFWLATTAVLYLREVAPQFRKHEPPPFAIDLTAETQVDHPHIVWKVFQNDRELYQAQTWIDHRESDDTFALNAVLKPAPLLDKKAAENLLIQQLTSVYRIGRDGDLRELEATVALGALPGMPQFAFDLKVHLAGAVRDGQLFATIDTPLFVGADFKFDPVPLSENGAVMLLLHPVHKIRGIWPGRTWRVPLVNPLADAVNAKLGKLGLFGGGDKVRFLQAQVLPEPQPFLFDLEEHNCWVIDYQGEEESAQTWVEVGTGLVLCQKATRDGESWRLERDSARSKIR